MEKFQRNLQWYILGILLGATVFVWYVLLAEDRAGKLTVSFLNIGQGDAIFIDAPNGNQMMIDGGPPKVALRELGRVMPFYDRSIDTLLVTNPDADHMGGFIDVVNSYKIARVIEPGTESPTATYAALEKAIEDEGAEKIIARRGMRIVLDREHGVVFTVLFPDRDVSGLTTNMGSVVGKLSYGDTCIIFPGDAPQAIEEYVVSLDGDNLKCQALKVGHHGSRTSSSNAFLAAVSPAFAVISAGLHNKYGHPHKEVLDELNNFEIRTLGTYKEGRVTLVSDGVSVSVR